MAAAVTAGQPSQRMDGARLAMSPGGMVHTMQANTIPTHFHQAGQGMQQQVFDQHGNPIAYRYAGGPVPGTQHPQYLVPGQPVQYARMPPRAVMAAHDARVQHTMSQPVSVSAQLAPQMLHPHYVGAGVANSYPNGIAIPQYPQYATPTINGQAVQAGIARTIGQHNLQRQQHLSNRGSSQPSSIMQPQLANAASQANAATRQAQQSNGGPSHGTPNHALRANGHVPPQTPLQRPGSTTSISTPQPRPNQLQRTLSQSSTHQVPLTQSPAEMQPPAAVQQSLPSNSPPITLPVYDESVIDHRTPLEQIPQSPSILPPQIIVPPYAGAIPLDVVTKGPPLLQQSQMGIATLRLLQFGSALTAALATPGILGLNTWVEDFYDNEAHLKFNLADVDHGHNIYDIPVAAAARFYDVLRESGVYSLQLLLESPREYVVTDSLNGPTLGYVVECENMTWIMSYRSGCSVFSKGSLRANFSPSYLEDQAPVKIAFMEYVFEKHTEYITRTSIVKKPPSPTPSSPSVLALQDTSANQIQLDSPLKQESETSLGNSYPPQPYKRVRQDDESDDATSRPRAKRSVVKVADYADSLIYEELSVPAPAVGPAGISDRAMRILEIAESVDHLGELISFSQLHGFGPLEALERYAGLCITTGITTRENLLGETIALNGAEQDYEAEATINSTYVNGNPTLSSPVQNYNAMAMRDYSLPPNASIPLTQNGYTAHSIPSSPLDMDFQAESAPPIR